jgi:hypothetical protein
MSLNATLDATVDGDVEFTFEVTNDGSTPVELTFRTGKRADVTVTDAETGEAVWRWGEGRMFTQAISTVEIASGERFDRTFTWNGPPAGSYEAEAELDADNRSTSATTTFTV